MHGTAEEVVQL